MIRRAIAAISAFRAGRIISVDGIKYISVPTHAEAVTEHKVGVWDRRGKQWRLVPANVNDSYSYLRKPNDNRLYATYALKSAVWDCAHVVASSVAVGSLYYGGFDALFPLMPGSVVYTSAWIIHIDFDDVMRHQREAIYAAIGRDKTGGRGLF